MARRLGPADAFLEVADATGISVGHVSGINSPERETEALAALKSQAQAETQVFKLDHAIWEDLELIAERALDNSPRPDIYDDAISPTAFERLSQISLDDELVQLKGFMQYTMPNIIKAVNEREIGTNDYKRNRMMGQLGIMYSKYIDHAVQRLAATAQKRVQEGEDSNSYFIDIFIPAAVSDHISDLAYMHRASDPLIPVMFIGDVGSDFAYNSTGGELIVHGSATDSLGYGASGTVFIEINGNAGHLAFEGADQHASLNVTGTAKSWGTPGESWQGIVDQKGKNISEQFKAGRVQ